MHEQVHTIFYLLYTYTTLHAMRTTWNASMASQMLTCFIWTNQKYHVGTRQVKREVFEKIYAYKLGKNSWAAVTEALFTP